MQQPRITVLMPVYNGAKYLRPAIESVLAQTFADFEFLIIDDGSCDDSLKICRAYVDTRIRLVENGVNLGLIATLNKGLGFARGEYIARMDCDDVCASERFEKQLRFMERHPEIGGCGTWFQKISEDKTEIIRPPVDDGAIRFFLMFDNAFAHNTMMLRRSVMERHALRYDPDYKYAEDYEFWVRCIRHAKFANLPEVLLNYRYHPENTSNRFQIEQGATADRVRIRHLESLGVFPDRDELELHNALAKFQFQGDMAGLTCAKAWLEKLVALGCRECGVPETAVYRHLARYWYGACGRQADLGWRVWRLFFSSPLGSAAPWEWQWKLLLRCLFWKRIEAAQP